MEVLKAFLVALVFSFLGSVFLGLVNVAVIETAIRKSKKSALWLAFGGVLPEIPYTLIAIFGTQYVDILEGYKSQIGIAIGIVFLVLGIGYFKSKSNVETGKPIETGAIKNFSKGFLLAIANPQLIFFWSGYLILFQTGTFSGGEPFFKFSMGISDPVKWSFAAGVVAGAYLILWIYAMLGSIYKQKLINVIGDRLGKVMGIVFIGIGIVTVIKNAI